MKYENIDVTEDTTRADCYAGLMVMWGADRGLLGDIIRTEVSEGRGLMRTLCAARNSWREGLASLG